MHRERGCDVSYVTAGSDQSGPTKSRQIQVFSWEHDVGTMTGDMFCDLCY